MERTRTRSIDAIAVASGGTDDAIGGRAGGKRRGSGHTGARRVCRCQLAVNLEVANTIHAVDVDIHIAEIVVGVTGRSCSAGWSESGSTSHGATLAHGRLGSLGRLGGRRGSSWSRSGGRAGADEPVTILRDVALDGVRRWVNN